MGCIRCGYDFGGIEMKWWHWLVLELLIIFGVMAWIYFFPSEIEDDFAKGMIGFVLIYAIEECKDINRRKTMSENYTVEQNAGENQIEGGVVSISGSVKKTELKDQLESYEGYINDIPLVIDPCKMCKVYKAKGGYDTGHFDSDGQWDDSNSCKMCCWYYDSKFEVGV